jgi:hypothetical protein
MMQSVLRTAGEGTPAVLVGGGLYSVGSGIGDPAEGFV